MEVIVWIFVVVAVSALAVVAVYRHDKNQHISENEKPADAPADHPAEKADYEISYIGSDMEWSGSTAEALPIKTLTYKQYDCLEDARYGFKIVGLTPSDRKLPQPDKTRAHGQKTVASLVKHGFLTSDGEGSYLINDLGLNALEVCSVRY